MVNYFTHIYNTLISFKDLQIAKEIFGILKVIFIAFLGIKLTDFFINRFYKIQKQSKFQFPDNKIKTLSSLTKNIARYIIYFIALASILKIFNIEMSSILAVAGIGSLAIGFGAQSLVKDIISGFFIIFEDQFSVGDYIVVNGISGVVEEIGLRITKVRGFSDGLHIIPNGEIKMVSNMTKDKMMAIVNIGVPLKENVDEVIEGINKICKDTKNERQDLINGPTIMGITDMQDSKLMITVYAETLPMQKWAVERDIRYRVKKMFDKMNISYPYPYTNVIITEESLNKE
ncbi:MAG: mechanosensitive ion channel family protein [Thermoanaerobacteraceae bacterium]